jgi:vacuolar-type H+-ATPase subunit H
LVFQASGKTGNSTNTAVGADFTDLERVKSAENKSILDIEGAEKNAEKIIDDAEKSITQHRTKSSADLKSKLDEEYRIEEQKAIEEAKKIKTEGDAEAQRLKEQVHIRIPNAVDRIVKAVIGGL